MKYFLHRSDLLHLQLRDSKSDRSPRFVDRLRNFAQMDSRNVYFCTDVASRFPKWLSPKASSQAAKIHYRVEICSFQVFLISAFYVYYFFRVSLYQLYFLSIFNIFTLRVVQACYHTYYTSLLLEKLAHFLQPWFGLCHLVTSQSDCDPPIPEAQATYLYRSQIQA